MDVRTLDLADLDAALDARTRSFGPLSAGSRDAWHTMMAAAIADERVLAVYDGKRVAALARINDFHQWWGGRSLRMAGVGGVVVAPEHRGRGAGSMIMTALLQRARERGYVVSALYPTTAPIYRGVGYEFGGVEHKVTVDAAGLRGLAHGAMVDVRRCTPADAGALRDLLDGLHERARDCGPITWPVEGWADELEDDDNFWYATPDGLLSYGWDGSGTLSIGTIAGGSVETLRTLWSLVGSGSSTVKTIKAVLAPHDPIRLLLRDQGLTTAEDVWWMVRLVDAPGAVAGRGFPAGVLVDVPVELADAQLPANAGSFRLGVADGRGVLEPAAPSTAAVRLGPGGLAALFAGTPTATLRRAGLVTGGSDPADAALDLAFAARPFMLDYF